MDISCKHDKIWGVFYFTRNARKALCMRTAAHSCLTAWKSRGGARTNAATAEVNGSAAVTDEVSDASDADRRLPLLDPDEVRHSFHILPLLTSIDFSC